MQNRVLSLLGLAVKAGKVVSGEFLTEKEVRTGRAALVIVAEDSSENTKKKFQNMCAFHSVPICFYGEKDTLGRAMGKEFRATLAISDVGFAGSIQKQMQKQIQTNDETIV